MSSPRALGPTIPPLCAPTSPSCLSDITVPTEHGLHRREPRGCSRRSMPLRPHAPVFTARLPYPTPRADSPKRRNPPGTNAPLPPVEVDAPPAAISRHTRLPVPDTSPPSRTARPVTSVPQPLPNSSRPRVPTLRPRTAAFEIASTNHNAHQGTKPRRPIRPPSTRESSSGALPAVESSLDRVLFAGSPVRRPTIPRQSCDRVPLPPPSSLSQVKNSSTVTPAGSAPSTCTALAASIPASCIARYLSIDADWSLKTPT